jgi:hypothetical protein
MTHVTLTDCSLQLKQATVHSPVLELIPVRKARDAHARVVLVKKETLLYALKATARSTCSLDASRNAQCFQSVCASRIDCRSYQ